MLAARSGLVRAAKAVSPKRMSLIHKTGNPLGIPYSCLRRRPFRSALHAAYLPYALLPSTTTRLLRARCKLVAPLSGSKTLGTTGCNMLEAPERQKPFSISAGQQQSLPSVMPSPHAAIAQRSGPCV